MPTFQMTIIGILVTGILVGAWMFRYDTKAGTHTTSIVLDRWTGEVLRCGVYIDWEANMGCERQY